MDSTFPEPRSLFAAMHHVMTKYTFPADAVMIDGKGYWKEDLMAPLVDAWTAMDATDATPATASRLLFFGLVYAYHDSHGWVPAHWPFWDEPSVLSRFVAFCMDKGADPTVSLAALKAPMPGFESVFEGARKCVYDSTSIAGMATSEDFDADINAVVLLVAYLLRPVHVVNPYPYACLVTMFRGIRAPLTDGTKSLCTWICIRTKNEELLGQLVALAFVPLVTDYIRDKCIEGNNIAGLAMAMRIDGPAWPAPGYARLETIIDRRAPGIAVALCQSGGPEVRAQRGAWANANGNTLLIRACKNGNLPVVRVLIRECGADVNATNRFGETPLWWAAKNGNPELVRLLLKHKATDRRVCLVARLYCRHTVLRELRAMEVVRKWRSFYLSRLISRVEGRFDAGVVGYIVGKVVG